jgi:hypothetical protein
MALVYLGRVFRKKQFLLKMTSVQIQFVVLLVCATLELYPKIEGLSLELS